MSDCDDDGFNSPEGKGISDEGQRRKAEFAQLTVEGGVPDAESGKGGPPEPCDMNLYHAASKMRQVKRKKKTKFLSKSCNHPPKLSS